MTHEDEIWAALGLPDKAPPPVMKPDWPFSYYTTEGMPFYAKVYYHTATTMHTAYYAHYPAIIAS